MLQWCSRADGDILREGTPQSTRTAVDAPPSPRLQPSLLGASLPHEDTQTPIHSELRLLSHSS